MTTTIEALEYRVSQLEKRQESISADLKSILTNHLPHIELAVLQNKIEGRIMTALQIGAIILALVIQRAFLQ